jgi:hypothetical protein
MANYFLFNKPMIVLCLGAVLLSACGTKAEIKTVESNQTAFLIPVAGDPSQQSQLPSIDFLKKKQVASKQVVIPYEWKETGSTLAVFRTGEYYPSMKLILVDRSMVTREWTKNTGSGTSNNDQAFGVESTESIDFKIGATCTAIITEADAATYLYYYGEKALSEVMDQNIRGFVQQELFNEFGSRTLSQAQRDKKLIFEGVRDRLTATFKERGVTILSFGGSEGMSYSDPKVQDVINESYAAQQRVEQAKAQATQQGYNNEQLVALANAQATATVIAGAAGAQVLKENGQMLQQYPGLTNYTLAQKSNGQVPQILVISGEQTQGLPFSFFLDPSTLGTPATK